MATTNVALGVKEKRESEYLTSSHPNSNRQPYLMQQKDGCLHEAFAGIYRCESLLKGELNEF